MSPSSPPLPLPGSGGVGVGRIGGGTFSPPEGVGVGKPPLLFTQDFTGPGPVGELLPAKAIQLALGLFSPTGVAVGDAALLVHQDREGDEDFAAGEDLL